MEGGQGPGLCPSTALTTCPQGTGLQAAWATGGAMATGPQWECAHGSCGRQCCSLKHMETTSVGEGILSRVLQDE